MAARLRATLAVLALLGVGAAAGAGLVLVGERAAAPGEPRDTAVDAQALLRDDVRALRADVDALATALGENFERLARAIEDGAVRRQAELRQDLGALDRALDRPRGEGAPPPVVSAATAPPPAAEGPAAQGTVPSTAAPTTAPAPPATASQGFLSFRLPNRALQFDREQTYEVVSELSRVGFDAKSTLHDFSGVTSKVRGELRANLADPNGAWRGRIECDAATLVTGVDGRDATMREHLDTAHHPAIAFTLARFEADRDGIDVAGQRSSGVATGRMSIRGVERELRMPVKLHVDDGMRLCIEGQASVRLPDYGVPVPSQLGLINMQEEVQIWIALRARPAAGGRDGR